MRANVILKVTLAVALAAVLTSGAQRCRADEVTLVGEGKAQAVIVAGPEARTAADRLNDLLRGELGVPLGIVGPAAAHTPGQVEVVLCTASERSELRNRLPARAIPIMLRPEGFLLAADAAKDGRIIAIGADAAGLRYAIGELWDYHVRLRGRSATLGASLWLEDAPAFRRRILWNWTFMTNWEPDLARIHQTKSVDPGGKLEPYLEQPDGYERQFTRVIDYAADHKLNGLIIYGFLNDSHGGVASAQRLSHHARTHAVRILPGVGTVIYGGFYHSAKDPSNPYSLVAWLQKHPEVKRMVGKDGKPIEAPCPSSPELHAFLVNGAKWFFSTFKDIGGVNIEHGDFFECQCDACKTARATPGNDANFLWDMMNTHVPVIETGHAINPDLWYTYSPYWGYRKEMMAHPPKFLKQYPDYAIVQWTYTGMVAGPIEKSWPADLKPPEGARHSIGLLHQGSYWYAPKQWWGSPGQTYALVPDIIQRACARAIDDASEGLEIIGQIGPVSPQNELNYLAFEEFTWHPKLAKEQWIEKRLAPVYGDPTLARRFLQLVGDETTSRESIDAARTEAGQIAARLTDPRQVRRWNDLARELARRRALIEAGMTKPYGPGPLQGVEDVVIKF
jgi:hypothetical protein